MLYQMLLNEADRQNVAVYENSMGSKIKGLYGDNIIWLNRGLASKTEKTCVLAEEMGHYYTTYGNILNQKKIVNVKQEKRARNWAYEKLMPLEMFTKAFEASVSNRYELAEFLGITEAFLEKGIGHYKEKFGLYTEWDDYLIYFDPLGVIKLFDG